jgi:chromosome segregation ATPase
MLRSAIPAAQADVSRYCTECEQAGKRVAELERLVQSTSDELHRKNNRILSLESGLAVKQLESALATANSAKDKAERERDLYHKANCSATKLANDLKNAIAATFTENERLRAVIANDCETEAIARATAAKVLGDKANGSPDGVPSVADLMDMVVGEAARLRQRVAKLEEAYGVWEAKP